MSVFEAKRVAVSYYESVRSATTVQGFSRYVAVEGEDAMFVPRPEVVTGVYVFLCDTRNSETYCEFIN